MDYIKVEKTAYFRRGGGGGYSINYHIDLVIYIFFKTIFYTSTSHIGVLLSYGDGKIMNLAKNRVSLSMIEFMQSQFKVSIVLTFFR